MLRSLGFGYVCPRAYNGTDGAVVCTDNPSVVTDPKVFSFGGQITVLQVHFPVHQ